MSKTWRTTSGEPCPVHGVHDAARRPQRCLHVGPSLPTLARSLTPPRSPPHTLALTPDTRLYVDVNEMASMGESRPRFRVLGLNPKP
jgi:hypothetical protein